MNAKRFFKPLSTTMFSAAFLFAANTIEVQADSYLPYEEATYQLTYENDGDGLVITGFEGKAFGDLLIPDEIDGIKVTSIGKDAFHDNIFTTEGFTGKLVIGNNVKTIEDYAFYGNDFTGELVIPASVESVGEASFAFCYGFTGDMVIPSTLKNIGYYAFANCTNIDGQLILPNTMTHIGDCAFLGCEKLSGELVIPDSVISIGVEAFERCKGFTGELKIPSSVEKIDVGAFWGCTGFQGDLVIPANVKEIGDRAFIGCTGLNKHVYLTEKTNTIHGDAFLLTIPSIHNGNDSPAMRQTIIIHGSKGSNIETYANTNHYSFAVWNGGERNPFADVKTGDWYYPFVKFTLDNNLMGGKGKDASGNITFDPNNFMTRAEFVQTLYNKEGKPAVTYSNRFKDVPEGAWYADAVLWAAENNIVAGVGDGTVFDVNGKITREQMATVLYKYANNYKKYETSNRADFTGYLDTDTISNWAKENIRWALAYGIMKGKGENIAPLANATRAECATMLNNFIEAFGK